MTRKQIEAGLGKKLAQELFEFCDRPTVHEEPDTIIGCALRILLAMENDKKWDEIAQQIPSQGSEKSQTIRRFVKAMAFDNCEYRLKEDE